MIDLRLGDCLDVMLEMPMNSIETCITDPPYGLSFMGRDWDRGVPGVRFWVSVLQVLKPGGSLLAFGGTRTYHRLACAIEDAGFEIIDCMMWLYSSGFPKSYNIGKEISKRGDDQWIGWGTALKPAYEPIIIARKKNDGSFVDNAIKWGVAGMNIDGARIPTDDDLRGGTCGGMFGQRNADGSLKKAIGSGDKGRFPANLVLDEGVAEMMGESARFFYVSKASSKERNEGLEDLPLKDVHRYGAGIGEGISPELPARDRNYHPTVKPVGIMRYLCELTRTPSGGAVLDPFMGSGTTGIACVETGRDFVGIEIDPGYFEIAKKRISSAHQPIMIK